MQPLILWVLHSAGGCLWVAPRWERQQGVPNRALEEPKSIGEGHLWVVLECPHRGRRGAGGDPLWMRKALHGHSRIDQLPSKSQGGPSCTKKRGEEWASMYNLAKCLAFCAERWGRPRQWLCEW